jgi:hypothetical protein
MIPPDELAAVSAALALLARANDRDGEREAPASRWRLAARRPDLEWDELRAHR